MFEVGWLRKGAVVCKAQGANNLTPEMGKSRYKTRAIIAWSMLSRKIIFLIYTGVTQFEEEYPEKTSPMATA